MGTQGEGWHGGGLSRGGLTWLSGAQRVEKQLLHGPGPLDSYSREGLTLPITVRVHWVHSIYTISLASPPVGCQSGLVLWNLKSSACTKMQSQLRLELCLCHHARKYAVQRIVIPGWTMLPTHEPPSRAERRHQSLSELFQSPDRTGHPVSALPLEWTDNIPLF